MKRDGGRERERERENHRERFKWFCLEKKIGAILTDIHGKKICHDLPGKIGHKVLSFHF